ncbi:MAG: Hsp20/alpha crystallin family protein [Pseudomonadota bacterium]
MNERQDVVVKEEALSERKSQIPTVAPMVDILENENEILLYADMPGVDKKDISINIDNGRLALSGIREVKPVGAVTWEEFGDVEYRRTFSVPQSIDVAAVHAELKEGVLLLHLPKSESARPRQIEIKAG